MQTDDHTADRVSDHAAQSDNSPDASSASFGPPRRRLTVWLGRLGAIAFGVMMAWLVLEVVLRALFFSLPPRMQIILRDVRITPFTDDKLMPDPIWQPDIDYLTIARPVTQYEQYGSPEVRFTVNTETLWNQRGAFRTRQELVDRYVDGIALGDSFTFCFTDEADCWVQQLGAQLNRNLINLGVVSTGSLSHQRVLQDFGLPLQPPLVLWQWFGNDANEAYGLARLRGETSITSAHEPPPAVEHGWLEKHSAVYALAESYWGEDDEYAANLQFLDREFVNDGDLRLGFGQPYLWGAFDMSEPSNQYGWERSQQAILQSRAEIDAYGGHLVILLMPTKEQVYQHLSEPVLGADKLALLDESRQMMLDFCAAHDLTCLDLLPVFQPLAEQGRQLYYTTDMHLNPSGNRILAGYLADWLTAHPEVFEKGDPQS